MKAASLRPQSDFMAQEKLDPGTQLIHSSFPPLSVDGTKDTCLQLNLYHIPLRPIKKKRISSTSGLAMSHWVAELLQGILFSRWNSGPFILINLRESLKEGKD